MILNVYDHKAISSIMIAQASMVNVEILLKEALKDTNKSKYFINKITTIYNECKIFAVWINKVNDSFVMDMRYSTKRSLINKASDYITKADELMGDGLNIAVENTENVLEKKTTSALTITQAALINADNIFTRSLKHSKNKDMMTIGKISDIVDKIEDYLEWIDEVIEFLSKFMEKNEVDAIMERANNYIMLADKESGLL